MSTPPSFGHQLSPTPVPHPSLALHITEPQRDRALSYLQGAYADGRLSADELDQRVGQALEARNRGELNAAFAGLVRIPLSSAAVGAHPAYAPVLNQHRDGKTGRAGAVVAHWFGIPTAGLGSALVYAVSEKDSYANIEAAKAFNFTVLMLGTLIFSALFLGWLPFDGAIQGSLAIVWFVLSVVGGLRASNGEDWVNPIMRIVPLRVLEDRPVERRPRPRTR